MAGSVDARARFPANVLFAFPKPPGCVLLYGCATRVDIDEMAEEVEG